MECLHFQGRELTHLNYCYHFSGPEDTYSLLFKFTLSLEGVTFEDLRKNIEDIETVSLPLGSVSIWLI